MRQQGLFLASTERDHLVILSWIACIYDKTAFSVPSTCITIIENFNIPFCIQPINGCFLLVLEPDVNMLLFGICICSLGLGIS